MITLRDSLVSSSARRLPMKRRADLSAKRQQYLGRSYWIVKEPLGLNYFRFHEEEFAILQMLDGETSLDEIKERFEAEFPPQKITLEELHHFLGSLHRCGLVVVDVPGQGKQLHKRRGERKWKEFLGALANVLSVKFKGIDPEKLLNWLYPKFSWFFSWPALCVFVATALCALLLVTVEFDEFRRKLPAFHDFFNLHNAFFLAITLGVTKVLHEFGHGLSCKHFGGECHELGVMLLVLTPCLYCNVSDSWMLPNKWHRMAIGAAGMYVELVLASFATFLWWFSDPGLIHYIALNVMFICSVSTVIFNANPLLRYDGYYILADFMEMPNLRQKASTVLSRKLGEWFLGLEPQEDPFLPEGRQFFFAAYCVASAVYRWVVLASILWFLYRVFKPYQLEVVGQTIAAASIISLVVMPLYQLGKFFYVPGRIEKVKKVRFYTSLGVVAALISAVLLVPLPYSVMCSLQLEPRGARPVYVDVAPGGRLEEVFVRPGQAVTAGQPVARLSSTDLDLQIAKIEGERAQLRAKLSGLDRLKLRDPSAANDAKPVVESLKGAEKQLAQLQRDRERLVLKAPLAGTVLPAPDRVMPHESDERLPEWSGSLFQPRAIGAWLKEGELFCRIGDPKAFDAVLVVDQTEVEMVRERLARVGLPLLPTKSKAASEGSARNGTAASSAMLANVTANVASNTPDGLALAKRDSLADGGAADKTAAAARESDDAFEGPEVAIKLEMLPSRTFYSHITDIAQSKLEATPEQLSARAGGEMNSQVDPNTGRERPRETVYQAKAPLEDPQGMLRSGLKGDGRVYVAWLPLGTRAWRWVMHTFNFRM